MIIKSWEVNLLVYTFKCVEGLNILNIGWNFSQEALQLFKKKILSYHLYDWKYENNGGPYRAMQYRNSYVLNIKAVHTDFTHKNLQRILTLSFSWVKIG